MPHDPPFDPPDGSAPAAAAGAGLGEWPAFELLVRARYGLLCACAARYVGPGAAAEDVVHDVLLRAWTQRHRIAEVDLLAYLVQSVRNAAVSALRQRRAVATRDERLTAELTTRPLASTDAVERADLARAVTAAIEQLPDRCRLIFLLHRDGGLTYRDIAERLGLSVKTVETQMGRALKVLRDRLAPYLCVSLSIVGDGVLRRWLG